MTSILSKQGFWLKTNSQRVLEVKTNTDTTEFNTSAPYGWRLLADTEAKTLKRLKFGNDAVWTYKDNTWFNANNYPDLEVERYRGFWTRGATSVAATTEVNTTVVVDTNISLVNESNSSLVGVNAALFELENNLNVTGTYVITLNQTAGTASYETVSPIAGVASYKSDGINGLSSLYAINFSQDVSYSAKYNFSDTTNGEFYYPFAFTRTGFIYFEHTGVNTFELKAWNGSNVSIISYGALNSNTTYTIGFTMNSSTQELIGYLNGVKVGSITYVGIANLANNDTIGINGNLTQPIPAGSLIDSIRLEQTIWSPAEMLLTH